MKTKTQKTINELIEQELEKVVCGHGLSPSSISLYSDLGKMIITNVAVNYLNQQTSNMTYDVCIEDNKEYARDQIMQDRKRIKKAYYDETHHDDTFNDLIKGTPIILE